MSIGIINTDAVHRIVPLSTTLCYSFWNFTASTQKNLCIWINSFAIAISPLWLQLISKDNIINTYSYIFIVLKLFHKLLLSHPERKDLLKCNLHGAWQFQFRLQDKWPSYTANICQIIHVITHIPYLRKASFSLWRKWVRKANLSFTPPKAMFDL
jgi:hypothetical protein